MVLFTTKLHVYPLFKIIIIDFETGSGSVAQELGKLMGAGNLRSFSPVAGIAGMGHHGRLSLTIIMGLQRGRQPTINTITHGGVTQSITRLPTSTISLRNQRRQT